MGAEWYYQTAGRTLGPVDAQQLKALAASGSIQATDQIRKGEAPNQWVKASAVKGLFPESPAARVAKPSAEDDFLDTVIQSSASGAADSSPMMQDDPFPAEDPVYAYNSKKTTQLERRDFPTLRFYARLAAGIGRFSLWFGILLFVAGIAGVVLTQDGTFAAAGVSAAIFFIILALGCYFASEIVQLGLYYATLLEDIRNRL